MKDKQIPSVTKAIHTSSVVPAENPLGPLQLDLEKYRSGLAEFEMTHEQENELLSVLWNIMSTIVDIGIGVDSVQTFLPNVFEKDSRDSGNLLQLESPKIFNEASASCAEKGGINE